MKCSAILGARLASLAVRRKCNPLYLPMMIAHESQVSKQAPEILPTGKFAGMDHQALQAAMRLYPCVCRSASASKSCARNACLTSTTITPESGRRR